MSRNRKEDDENLPRENLPQPELTKELWPLLEQVFGWALLGFIGVCALAFFLNFRTSLQWLRTPNEAMFILAVYTAIYKWASTAKQMANLRYATHLYCLARVIFIVASVVSAP